MSSSLDDSSRLSLDSPFILKGLAPLDIVPSPPTSITTLPQLFQHRAQTHPEHIAFSCQTHNGFHKVTYKEADAVAASLAKCIEQSERRKSQIENDQAPRVAIWLEKGLDLILSILATTYSGATWLPFDPDMPVERAAICIQDAAATAIICDAAHLERAREVQERATPYFTEANEAPLKVVTFEELEKQSSTPFPVLRTSGPRPTDVAYVIYTSGTTGTPKGIAIPHSAALTFALSEREILETNTNDIVWNGFSPAFDMFVEEMWVTIAGGSHLAIGTREECRDVASLPSIWTDRGVSIVNAVPTLMSIMGITQMDQDSALLPPCVRLINLGGEACPPSLVNRLARPGLRIINTYGPTETTVTATWDELQRDVPVTIGRPLPSYHACLLPISEDGSPVPDQPVELTEGAEGELAIGGPCVGLGYLGREELTAQKFIHHPLAPNSGERLYRTGDRVKLQADMKIVYLGRIDTQVKHRGFRIELGEIESVLSSHPTVMAAALILAEPGSDTARLEAFVVTQSGATQDAAALQQLVSDQLPSYMRPDQIYYIESDDMPRLPSGKINAKGLHELSTRKAAERASSITEYASSESDTVLDLDTGGPLGILLKTLSTVFPKANVKPQSDFFADLGGHSLLAAMLVSKLRQAEDEDGNMPFASLSLSDIYEGRTAYDIADRFTASETSSFADSLDFKKGESNSGPRSGEHLPVSRSKYVLCGLAQILPLCFLFFVNSIDILVPYLLFDYLAVNANIGWAVLATYGMFVAIPPFRVVLAISGKWLFLGKAQPGEYPLYGMYYFRWWLAERCAALANPKLIADSALYPLFLRAMGAKVGKYCHIGVLSVGASYDLVEIGDDVVIGADVCLGVNWVERGRLILKKVVIRSDALIGTSSVIEGGTVVGEGAELAPLSMVPDGIQIPAMQRFHGSPAQYDREVANGEGALGKKTRPSSTRAAAMLIGNLLMANLALPLLYFAPQVPGLILFDALDLRDIGQWAQVAILSVPITMIYQSLVFTELALMRYAVLGRMKEGKYKIYSSWYLRRWFVERLMDLALDILHQVFATLYIVPFLRILGVNIGKGAEVSNARGFSGLNLLDIGEECFVADAVRIGNPDIRGNELTLKRTKLEPRSFAGNASVLSQGTTLASGTLVGVLSIAPATDKPLKENTSCFGSPPVLMPARHQVGGHDENLLFRPSKGRIAARLFIEGVRIVLPQAVIIFGIGFGLQIAYVGYAHIGAVYTLLMLPAFFFLMFALPAVLITALLKWSLMGRYKPAEWPLWSLNVWLSEAVTSTFETITENLLGIQLVGTPYMAWIFRLMGVKVGSMVTLLASDITEFDCVSIGDEAMVNFRCATQTHLFEDRVMKIGRIHIGNRACLKPYSICLPGSTVSDGAQLGSLSLAMKGETLPKNTAWEGLPVAPRARRSPARSEKV